MEWQYILLICAGGVFLLITIVYLLAALDRKNADKRNMNAILDSYSEEKLRKMEYDTAFYDKNVFKASFVRDSERQVTIDDVLAETDDDMTQLAEQAVFTQVEDEGKEVIRGNYNSEI